MQTLTLNDLAKLKTNSLNSNHVHLEDIQKSVKFQIGQRLSAKLRRCSCDHEDEEKAI